MAQIINTNLASMNAQRNLNSTQTAMNQSIQRLSSGLRVNSSKDDAAGMAIAERMNSQIRGMNVAVRNANDGISLAQVADGALGQLADLAQRMRELAVQANNATNGTGDRSNLDTEFQQLAQELTRTITGTQFNGQSILATGAGTQTYQIGAGTTANDKIDIVTSDLSADPTVAAVTASSISTAGAAGAEAAMTNIDAMLDTINTQRATYGAAQNRFSSVIATLQVSAENQTAARSRIMDADFAAETAAMTRAQVLQQAGQAMVSQANQMPSGVLALLKGL